MSSPSIEEEILACFEGQYGEYNTVVHARIKALIDRTNTQARISELKQLEPPEQYEEYAKLMGSEQCNICGFNAVEFRKYIKDRIKALSQEQEDV